MSDEKKNDTSDFAKPAERVPLQQLADQGIEQLLTSYGRALPDDVGQVGVSAFQSSI